MDDLYDSDILEWSEHQAEMLRRVAANDRLNSESPDWLNIIEEIESVGREQLRAVETLLLCLTSLARSAVVVMVSHSPNRLNPLNR
jgi:hypothetical protein